MFRLLSRNFNKIGMMSNVPLYNLPLHLRLSLFSFQCCTFWIKKIFNVQVFGCLHTIPSCAGPLTHALSYLLAGPCQLLEGSAIFNSNLKSFISWPMRLPKRMPLPQPFLWPEQHSNLPLRSSLLTRCRGVGTQNGFSRSGTEGLWDCLLYTSDAADEVDVV